MADPNYKSIPKSWKNRPPVERENLKEPRPLRGVFSDKAKGSGPYKPGRNTPEDFQSARKDQLAKNVVGSVGKVLRGKRDLSHQDEALLKRYKNGLLIDPDLRERGRQIQSQTGVRGAARQLSRSVYDTALRFGSDEAFYWLVGLIVPTFGLSILGLNVLLMISRIRKAMKMWQKIVIVLLDIAILLLILIVLLTTLIYFCNVTIPFGSKIAKGLGYVTSNKYLTFCQYFDIADISKGAQSTTSGSVQGATDFRQATLPAVDFLPRGR